MEVSNRIIRQSLRKFRKPDTDWEDHVGHAQRAMRAAPTRATGFSPHELCFVQKMVLPHHAEQQHEIRQLIKVASVTDPETYAEVSAQIILAIAKVNFNDVDSREQINDFDYSDKAMEEAYEQYQAEMHRLIDVTRYL